MFTPGNTPWFVFLHCNFSNKWAQMSELLNTSSILSVHIQLLHITKENWPNRSRYTVLIFVAGARAAAVGQLSRMERAAKIPVIEEIDDQTRCKHWNSPLDVIAIKMPCCGKYFSCFECHRESTDHTAKVWRKSQFASELAILCGSCKIELTVEQYLDSGSSCPRCQAAFNPRCSAHYHLYFEQWTI